MLFSAGLHPCKFISAPTALRRVRGNPTVHRIALTLLYLSAILAGAPAFANPDTSSFSVPAYWARPIQSQGEPPWHEPFLADLSAETCGLCHPAQLAAWRSSLHARAVSPGLLGQLDALDGATQEACLACHAPLKEALDLWNREGLDAASRIPAVDCAACHVRAHVRHGPREIAITPHGPVHAQPLFTEAEFCATCHQFDETGLTVNGKPLENTYTEWLESRYAREGVTCQSCHMPAGAHDFLGIHDRETTRRGLTIEARRTVDSIRVRAGNTGAGHALPTYVTPRILIEVSDTSHEPGTGRGLTHTIARQMRWSQELGWEELADTRLLPDDWIELELAVPPAHGGRVEVRVEPDYDYHDRVYPTLLNLLEGRLHDAESALLRDARRQAGVTPYVLYRYRCPPWSGRTEPCDELP